MGTDGHSPAARRPGRRRDRHGRGLRGMLAPRPVPIAHSRGDAFDAMVLHAVDHLQPRLAEQLAQVEFAVEDVPEVSHRGPADFDYDEDILDDNAVPLSRLYRNGVGGISAPVIVVYRRPLESRAAQSEDLADLVHDVVVEQLARLLGRSTEEIDPPAPE
ncbi:metallopeptidase family protein [Jatrophihabitans sp.]|uniref:metallopeptidase family protein n=1 Tax=Jatrophihabitans sp. TaxID=1932789 RepID=UPI002F05B247